MNDETQISERLEQFRTRHNIDQRAASSLFGVPYSTYRSWESHGTIRRNPSAAGQRLLFIFETLEVMNPPMLKELINLAIEGK